MRRYRYPPPPTLIERFDASIGNGTIELSVWHAAHLPVLWVETACGCEFQVIDRDTYVSDRGMVAERLGSAAQRAGRQMS